MSSPMLRTVLRSGASVSKRCISSSASKQSGAVASTDGADAKQIVAQGGGFVYNPDLIHLQYPKLGNRDIVGYGMNGDPYFMERQDFPYPAIRFKENTADVMALREKEKGDWKSLSLADKKALYRASFCSTYAEMDNQANGQWKVYLAWVLAAMGVTWLNLLFLDKYAYGPRPDDFNPEQQMYLLARMFREQTGRIDGIYAEYLAKEEANEKKKSETK